MCGLSGNGSGEKEKENSKKTESCRSVTVDEEQCGMGMKWEEDRNDGVVLTRGRWWLEGALGCVGNMKEMMWISDELGNRMVEKDMCPTYDRACENLDDYHGI